MPPLYSASSLIPISSFTELFLYSFKSSNFMRSCMKILSMCPPASFAVIFLSCRTACWWRTKDQVYISPVCRRNRRGMWTDYFRAVYRYDDVGMPFIIVIEGFRANLEGKGYLSAFMLFQGMGRKIIADKAGVKPQAFPSASTARGSPKSCLSLCFSTIVIKWAI